MKKNIKKQKKKLKIFDPKLKEECGVFGVSNTKDASALTALIRSQQNRMHLVPLSLIQCSLLLTFDRAN